VPYFQFPGLSGYECLNHAVFTRLGGVSASVYGSLNAGFNTGDEKDRVTINLRIIQEVIGAKDLCFVNQAHGTNILVLRKRGPRPLEAPATADAMITNLPGLGLLVKQADCQAVLFFDPKRKVISNAHCGWRGNTRNVLGAVVERMKKDFGCDPGAIRAAVGPSLGPCCAEFVTHEQIFPDAFRAYMVRRNFFDLWEISRSQLLKAGLKEEHIEMARICTRCRSDLFYSYRREGTTGRFATVIMLKPTRILPDRVAGRGHSRPA